MNLESSTELKALIAICSSSFLETKTNDLISTIEWEELFLITKKHRVSSIVYKNLTDATLSIPENFKTKLASETKKSTIRMLKFTAEISIICSELKKLSISIIPLKGPIAAKQIYGDYTAKNSRDIDFLIQIEELEKVINWLEEQGYENSYPFNSLSKKQKKAFQKANNQLAFFHPEKKIQVELHWRLFANSYLLPISFQDLLKDGYQITVGKSTINCLSNKHLLFYLITHGAKHNWSLLYWLMEVATLIQKEKFDWETTLEESIQLGIERPLVQGIILIESLFKIPAPSVIHEYYTNQKVIQGLVKSSIQAINDNSQDQAEKSISNYWQKLSYKLKLKKSWRYKLAYWNAISINDFELIKLPDSLFFGYFWLRPFFWIWRYLIQPIKKS
jgi:hypothetical protein